MPDREIDSVLEKLAKDVEAAVHALYRGEVRQQTARVRTGSVVKDARAALDAVLAQGGSGAAPAPSPRPSVAAPVVAGGALGWSREEGEAVLKCINSWLPMGPPNTADPAGKCVSAARELTPTWGQRELARTALRRIS